METIKQVRHYRSTPEFALRKLSTKIFDVGEELSFSYDFAGTKYTVNVDKPGYYSKDGSKHIDIVNVCDSETCFPMKEKDAEIFIKAMHQAGTEFYIQNL